MAEDKCSETKNTVSAKVQYFGTEIGATGNNWSEVLTDLGIGVMKQRIIGLCGQCLAWVQDTGWVLGIPESVGKVRDRIVLVLLLHSPLKLTRTQLSSSSSVEAGSLRNYLTKEDLGVVSLIAEDAEGITLNATGYAIATEILETLLKATTPGVPK